MRPRHFRKRPGQAPLCAARSCPIDVLGAHGRLGWYRRHWRGDFAELGPRPREAEYSSAGSASRLGHQINILRDLSRPTTGNGYGI